jgi:hypothetical protein
VLICITLRRLSQPPNVNSLLTNYTEYGSEATGEVPSLAFVENATPIDAMNRPIQKECITLAQVCFDFGFHIASNRFISLL